MAGQSKNMTRPQNISDSEYDREITNHVQRIRKKGTGDLSVDPHQDTITYLFGLLSHRTNFTDQLLIALSGFLTSYDPVQARYAGTEWRMCIQMAAEIVQQTGDARTCDRREEQHH